ncbi:hypothetical protein ES708_12429 [subsurface metagenome]
MATTGACWGGLDLVHQLVRSTPLAPWGYLFRWPGDSPPFFAVRLRLSHHTLAVCSGSLWSPCHQFWGTAYGRAPAVHGLPGIWLPTPLLALGSFPSPPPFFPRLGAEHGVWLLFWWAGHGWPLLSLLQATAVPVPFLSLPTSSILIPLIGRAHPIRQAFPSILWCGPADPPGATARCCGAVPRIRWS